ncbi:MAG: helical backbone metal receptor [Methanosarcinales archaeon Met12]|nr:MAG: helical backbone metal receptor [Methanosarcinales archaeon Met12]
MSIKMARKIAILLIAGILLICSVGLVSASPVITSWGNDFTNDNSTNITVSTGTTVMFNATANETITTWNWTVNSVDQDNNASTFNYTFLSYGMYNVNVSGTNANGTTPMVTWNVTVELVITDDLGKTWRISQQPLKIVSLAPSNTEILFAVGAGNRVVGVTNFCDYPLEVGARVSAGNITRVGGFVVPSTEIIINLTPDLILAAHGNRIDVINKLIVHNFTVVALHPKNISDILGHIELVGDITRQKANATALTTNMTQRIETITSNTTHYSEAQRLRVLHVVWYPGIWVAGSGTFPHDIIQQAGGVNIASGISGWSMMSLEDILVGDPEVIITSGMGGGSEIIKANLMNNTIIQQTTAYRDGRIHAMGDPNIIERPGPRIVYGLEEFYSVFRSTPPITTIASSAGTSTFATSTVISGAVRDADPKSLTLNGVAITPAVDGSYSRGVSLSIGYNTFTVVATDLTGNSVTQTITVKRLLAGGVAPAPTPVPTPVPTPTPEPEPKPWYEIPGFGAIFAILGLLAVAYLCRRSKI